MSGCEACGSDYGHVFPYHCPRDLHGPEDWAKSSCAWCEEPIEPNAPRVADKFGNLYCSTECLAEGYAELFERVAGGGGPDG